MAGGSRVRRAIHLTERRQQTRPAGNDVPGLKVQLDRRERITLRPAAQKNPVRALAIRDYTCQEEAATGPMPRRCCCGRGLEFRVELYKFGH